MAAMNALLLLAAISTLSSQLNSGLVRAAEGCMSTPLQFKQTSQSGKTKLSSAIVVTDNVIELQRGSSRSVSSHYIDRMMDQARLARGLPSRLANGSSNLLTVDAGQVFLAPITIGGQSFDVVVDTGSSDTWVVASGFTCISPESGSDEAQSKCEFGTTYNPSASSTYSAVSDENFNVTYADFEFLNGEMGYEEITLGGVTVPKQEIGIVSTAQWYGDGYSSGLVGFAYSTLTSAYLGMGFSADERGESVLYNPLFTTMWSDSLIAPIFSLVLNRGNNSGGILALGGIPNVTHIGNWVQTPIISAGIFTGSNTPAYEYYSVKVDGFTVTSTSSSVAAHTLIGASTPVIDSGTSLLYAPAAVANAVAAAFDPPGSYDAESQAYLVNCNAAAPVLGVSIAGQVFHINPKDLIVAKSGGCVSGVQSDGGGYAVLGDVFLKNVVAVFDVGAEVMRFASREFYRYGPGQ